MKIAHYIFTSVPRETAFRSWLRSNNYEFQEIYDHCTFEKHFLVMNDDQLPIDFKYNQLLSNIY